MDLHHARLSGTKSGCMYASLYAVTGDDYFLNPELFNDVNSIRHSIRALERGWLIHSIYVHPYQTCERSFWNWFQRQAPPHQGGYIPLIVSIKSYAIPGERHMVGMYLDWEGKFWVSDSNREGILQFDTLSEFLASDYAEAFEVEQLARAELDAHLFIDADKWLEEG